MHGAGEYGGRYSDFAQFLSRAGFAVAAIDLRGFGKSGGPRAFVESFSDYAADVDAVAAQLLRVTGSKTFNLLGHSMGGLVAASAASEHRMIGLASLTLSSPCMTLSFPVPAHIRTIGAIYSRLYPRKLFPTKAISDLLTHDKEKAGEHRTDPQIVHWMSARLFFEMNHTMQHFTDLAGRIDVPVGVFQAGDDRVVSALASHIFYESLSHSGKRWKLYQGFFHEILNETNRAAVYEDILSFLNSVTTT